MNPKNTIRPWLLACSIQGKIGATEAYETNAPDMSGKPEHIYFVYHVSVAKQTTKHHPVRSRTLPDPEGYDVVVSASQQWQTKVIVDLYNSENGLSELAGCAVAAESNEDVDIQKVLRSGGIEFVPGSAEVENKTTRDGTRFYYHHRMVCYFNTVEGFRHTKTNHRVDTVNLDDAFSLETE
jgi:hypothetical protein